MHQMATQRLGRAGGGVVWDREMLTVNMCAPACASAYPCVHALCVVWCGMVLHGMVCGGGRARVGVVCGEKVTHVSGQCACACAPGVAVGGDGHGKWGVQKGWGVSMEESGWMSAGQPLHTSSHATHRTKAHRKQLIAHRSSLLANP